MEKDYTKDIVGFTQFVCKATEEAFNRDGELVPVAHILKKTDDDKPAYGIFPAHEFMRDVNGKELLNNILQKIGSEQDTLSVIFATEIWMSVMENVDKGDIDCTKQITPSQDPNRQEGVMLSINNKISNTMKMYKIDRSGKKPVLIRDKGFLPEDEGEAKIEGRFANLM